jgi:cbb3-type cytochrome oxidase maturation protein
MSEMAPLASFFWAWVAFSLLTLGGLAAFLVWAIRSGQFSDQDRARYLPLLGGIPNDEKGNRKSGEKKGANHVSAP